MVGFASKVIDHLRFGFAAGVGFETVAMPRRNRQIIPGYAPGSGCPSYCWAKGRTKGIAQSGKTISTAGHSHRREANSGGKAEADPAHDF